MSQIEFIPIIKPATKGDSDGITLPSGDFLTNPAEWEKYCQQKIKKTYGDFPEPILKGTFQFRLFDLELEHIEKIIEMHIGDTDVNESISLFGGYAISKNGIIELFPQCCGLLEDIQSWKKILNENFEDFSLGECHPSPLITKRKNEIIIHCKDSEEDFFPFNNKEEIKLDYYETRIAFEKLLSELDKLSKKINSLSAKFKTENLAEIMIWGKQE